jgi:pimeloyl-ACP methyl ester carboxylesterase
MDKQLNVLLDTRIDGLLEKADSMDFKKEKIVNGVVQRDFDIEVAGATVPCVIWSMEHAEGPRPIILMGHGGSQHKKTEGIRLRAANYARHLDWATLAIDAPGHGDRISREEAEQLAIEVGARVRGESNGPTWDPARLKLMSERSKTAVSEWIAALDAAQSLDFVGTHDRIGYWGVSMGTAFGVPFLAAEPRIKCAVLGLAGLRPGATEFEAAASKITIPIQFVFQWEDAVAPRDNGIALFNALGSKEKTMHINPGGHMDIPAWEPAAWRDFFKRHLERS